MANKDERILMAIDAETKERLQAAAEKEGISMSEFIRRLIVGKIEGDKVIWGTDTEYE